ncbi:MAG: inositol monophosphatase family protein [Candidatus Nanopelagicaceae bacterium]|jgi:histidinol-phosphatase
MSTHKYGRQEDLALALQIADAADLITSSRYQSLDLIITTKPDNTPVTDADKATEEAIRNILQSERPQDGLVGEEFGETKSTGSRYWVIDPIDGTKNFMRAVPTWATLIALVEDGEVVVGVASAPALCRRWYAAQGLGAHVVFNKSAPRKISVSKVSEIKDASVAYSDFAGWGERRPAFDDLIDQAWRTRGFGDFWSHMLVAEGSADVAAEPVLALWDMAALDIIVREAGGKFTSVSGEPGPTHGSALSTNGLLHQSILNQLNSHRK